MPSGTTTTFGYWHLIVLIPTFACPSDATIKDGRTRGVSEPSFTSYGANGLVFGKATTTTVSGTTVTCTYPAASWQATQSLPSTVPDGLSNTILRTEKLSFCNFNNLYLSSNQGNNWAAAGTGKSAAIVAGGTNGASSLPPNLMAQVSVENSLGCYYFQPSSSHTALLVGLGDGSVRAISSGVQQTTLNIAFVPNDALTLPSDW